MSRAKSELAQRLPRLHIEPRHGALTIGEALSRARRDAGERIPVVAHGSKGDKLATLAFSDLVQLVRAAERSSR